MPATSFLLVLALYAGADATPPKRLAIIAHVVARSDQDRETTALNIHASCAQVASYTIGVSPLSRSEMLQGVLDDEIRECGSDTRCIAARLEAAEIDLGAILVVNQDVQPPLISMRLIDTDRAAILSERSETLPRGATLMSVVATEFASLLDHGGHPTLGKVIVDVTPADARVVLADAPLSALSIGNTFVVQPGPHRLIAGADGHVETSTSVLVRRLQDSHVALHLAQETPLLESPWFWGAIAFFSAAAITTSVLVLQGEGRFQICHSRNPIDCDQNKP